MYSMSCKNCYCSIENEMYLDRCLGSSVNSVLFVNEPNLRAADLGRVVTDSPEAEGDVDVFLSRFGKCTSMY